MGYIYIHEKQINPDVTTQSSELAGFTGNPRKIKAIRKYLRIDLIC